MTRDQMIDSLVDNLVTTARFWLKNGYSMEYAWSQALAQSCAGPLPRRLAAEKLGMTE